MHLDINETVSLQDREETTQAYKLYNLLFAGKISLADYLHALRRLNDNKELNQGRN